MPRRERCLDVFRGLTVAGMIIVNNPGNDSAYAPLEHSAWNGCTPTDLVFPFFVFILGAAVPYALGRRLEKGEPRGPLLRQALRRAAVLFALGLLMNAWSVFAAGAPLRLPGVLQRLALCYAATAWLYLYAGARAQAALAGAALLGYALLLRWWGDLSPAGNLPAVVDRALMGGHLYTPQFDPEGVLSTVPAVAQSVLGALTGRFMRAQVGEAGKLRGLAAAGGACALAGLALSPLLPVNKALWTSTFVLWTTGLALLFLGALHLLVEGGERAPLPARPFEALGVSALAAYVLSGTGVRLMHLWKLARPDGEPGHLRYWLTDHLLSPFLSPPSASLAFALAYLAAWILLFRALYKRNIILKI